MGSTSTKAIYVSAALSLIIGLVGCSSPRQETQAIVPDGQAPEVEAAEEVVVEDEFDEHLLIQSYFDAVDQSKPQDIIQGREFAAEGSNADKYAIEQAAFAQAELDAGDLDIVESHFTLYGDEGFMCPIELADLSRIEMQDAVLAGECVSYSGFQFEGGKLSNFNAGTSSLDGRIEVGDGTALAIGDWGRVQHLASYVTMIGDLIVVFEVSSMTDGLQMPWDATLLLDNGRVMESSYTIGVSELDADRITNIAFLFQAADLGGKVEMVFTDDDWNEKEMAIPLVAD